MALRDQRGHRLFAPASRHISPQVWGTLPPEGRCHWENSSSNPSGKGGIIGDDETRWGTGYSGRGSAGLAAGALTPTAVPAIPRRSVQRERAGESRPRGPGSFLQWLRVLRGARPHSQPLPAWMKPPSPKRSHMGSDRAIYCRGGGGSASLALGKGAVCAASSQISASPKRAATPPSPAALAQTLPGHTVTLKKR